MCFGDTFKQLLNPIKWRCFFKELPADVQCSFRGIFFGNQNLQLQNFMEEQILQSSSIFLNLCMVSDRKTESGYGVLYGV